MKKTVLLILAALCTLALCACTTGELAAPDAAAQTIPQTPDRAAQTEVAAQPAAAQSEAAQTVPQAPDAAAPAAPAQPVQPADPAAPQADIGEEEAIRIALADAGLTAEQVTMIKAELDRDDGRYKYDIDFYSGNTEYEYELDPATGTILEADHDIENFDLDDYLGHSGSGSSGSGSSNVSIPESDAAAAALARVPGASSDDLRMHIDYDDGRTVYEGEIVYNGVEYDFEIDASNGSIREWDEDRYDYDDDRYDDDDDRYDDDDDDWYDD